MATFSEACRCRRDHSDLVEVELAVRPSTILAFLVDACAVVAASHRSTGDCSRRVPVRR